MEIRNVRQWPFALALLDMARKKLEASWEASQANAALLEQQKLVDGQRLAKQIQRGFG